MIINQSAMKGKDTFTKEEAILIRDILKEVRVSEGSQQKQVRENKLRREMKFYISDFVPKYKSVLTDYYRKVGFRDIHFDQLIENQIISITD